MGNLLDLTDKELDSLLGHIDESIIAAGESGFGRDAQALERVKRKAKEAKEAQGVFGKSRGTEKF